MKHTAIVLAAGQGKRMHSDVQKQYLLIKGKPVLYYSLQLFENTPFIEDIILVTGENDITYCRKEIIDRYHFTKVKQIVVGGCERYDSVYNGLEAIENCDYVYIHDGARPFLNTETMYRLKAEVEHTDACLAAVPSKDTVKMSDEEGVVADTPDRNRVWIAQTPQVFSYPLVKEAYRRFLLEERTATDDAMVVEMMMNKKVKLVLGDYRNIKITTPEDLLIAQALCE